MFLGENICVYLHTEFGCETVKLGWLHFGR